MNYFNNNKFLSFFIGILAFIALANMFHSDDNQIQKIEMDIYRQGLNEDRAKTRIKEVLNPSGNGICLRKRSNTPLNVIETDGHWITAKTEKCGSIVTEYKVSSGGNITIGHKVYSVNHIFIEKINKNADKQETDSTAHICIAVDKLSQLPEYETKGPWFIFPCIPIH